MYVLAPHSTFLEEGITETIIFLSENKKYSCLESPIDGGAW